MVVEIIPNNVEIFPHLSFSLVFCILVILLKCLATPLLLLV